MTYYFITENFRRWLNRAQTALVSKNKVRKDLWIDFCYIVFFELTEEKNVFQISQTQYTSISSFLQTEGRSDSLKDDSILNWITTLHDLRRALNDELRYVVHTRPATPRVQRVNLPQASQTETNSATDVPPPLVSLSSSSQTSTSKDAEPLLGLRIT